jgi:hypothetical protein
VRVFFKKGANEMKRFTSKIALITAAKKIFRSPSISDYGNTVWIFQNYDLVGHFDTWDNSGSLAFTKLESANLAHSLHQGR